MLIAMAGLPGTGKSALAACLAPHLYAVILSKDTVRSVLFPPPVLDYSREQDDITMTAIYRAAALILKTNPTQTVILDGRTFLRVYQVGDLCTLASEVHAAPRIIECVCAEDVVRERLARDAIAGTHPARNRTLELYRKLLAQAEPIEMAHLVLDTGRLPLEECVTRSLAFLKA
jgi:predicted kinase